MTESAVFEVEFLVVLPVARQPERAAKPFRVLDTSDVHREEREAFKLRENQRPDALCLSGGGIRSAAFCFGVLQAFARRKLLHQFHYLSNVSGGGYIGGWLTRCIAEQNELTRNTGKDSVEAVEDAILAAKPNAQQPEAPQVSALRRHTHFLTPHPGLATVDTWAGARCGCAIR